jgi:hypothetical protein
LTLLIVGFIVWRYRQVLGLDKTWDRYGREHADELATRLGWRDGRRSPRPGLTRQATVDRAAPSRSLLSYVDGRRLPAALTAGALEALVIVGLELQNYTFLASLTSLLVGPFVGGAYLRTRWWMLVAAAIAVIVGAGGRLGPVVVALPVAVIAYAGIRTDLRAVIARWNAATDEPGSPT